MGRGQSGQYWQDSEGQRYTTVGMRELNGKYVIRLVSDTFGPMKDSEGRERVKVIKKEDFNEWASGVTVCGFID